MVCEASGKGGEVDAAGEGGVGVGVEVWIAAVWDGVRLVSMKGGEVGFD